MKSFAKNLKRRIRLLSILRDSVLVASLLLMGIGTLHAGDPIKTENGSSICPCIENGYEIGEPGNPASITYLSQSDLPLNPNELIGGCVNIYGKLIVDMDYTFDGCAIVMGQNAEIEVTAYDRLTIKNQTFIYGCTEMWKSITLKFFAELDMENSTVRDAMTAVEAQNLSKVRLVGNTFDANNVGFYIPPVALPTQNNVYLIGGTNGFKDNLFTATQPLLPPMVQGAKPYAGVLIYNTNWFSIGHPINGSIQNRCENLKNGIMLFEVNGGHFTGFQMAQIGDELSPNNGSGVYIIKNIATVNISSCYMEDMSNGIVADQVKGLNVKNNYIQVSHNNGIVISDSGKGNVIIDANEIVAKDEPAGGNDISCIGVINCGISSSRHFDITNNTIQASAGGIAVAASSGKLTLSGNDITFPFTPIPRGGIDIGGCDGEMTIKESNIDALSGYAGAAINISGSQGIQVVDNTASGNFYNGLISWGAPDILYCCNYVSGMRNGVLLIGMCNNTNLRNTTFGGHDIGLYEYDAITGFQLNPGNDWTGAITSIYDAYYNGNVFNMNSSLIQTNNSLIPNGHDRILVYDPTQPPSPTNPHQGTDWFEFQGQDPTCATEENCGIPPYELSGGGSNNVTLTGADLLALSPPTDSSLEAQVLRWEGQRYLYRKLMENPALVGTSTEVSDFFTATQNGPLGSLYQVEKGIRNLANPPSEMFDPYQTMLHKMDSLSESLDSIAIQLLSATPSEQILLSEEADSIKAQLSLIYEDWVAIDQNLEDWRSNQVLQLAAFNDSINTSNDFEANLKRMFEVYLDSAAMGYEISTVQKSDIDFLADQCPNTAGSGVFWARALRQRYAPGWPWQPEDCLDAVVGERTVQRDSETSQVLSNESIRLYPNPSKGFFKLTLTEPLSEEGMVSVESLEGRVLFSRSLAKETQECDLDLTGLNSGMYLVSVKQANALLFVERIVIID